MRNHCFLAIAFSLCTVAFQLGPAHAYTSSTGKQQNPENGVTCSLLEVSEPANFSANASNAAKVGTPRGLVEWSWKNRFSRVQNDWQRKHDACYQLNTGYPDLTTGKSLEHVALVSPTASDRQMISPDFLQISIDAAVRQLDQAHYTLDNGSVIINPRTDIDLDTPHAHAVIAKHSVILIEVDQEKTNILDLHDSKLNSVRVSMGEKAVSLAPGKAAAFGINGKFEQQLMRDGLARRKVKIWSDETHRSVMTYEFSLVQAHSTRRLLSELAHSDMPADKKVMSRLIKTAAVLSLVTTTHGAYQAQN